MQLKESIKQIVPDVVLGLIRSLRDLSCLLPNAWYDTWRYFVYSGMNRSRFYQGEQEARITMAYHQIEKGLSLSEPRRGFGEKVIERLLNELSSFIAKYGLVTPAINSLASLEAYIEFNEQSGLDMSVLRTKVSNLHDLTDDVERYEEGGVIDINLKDVASARSSTFDQVFKSRYSIRHFTGLPIKQDDLLNAVKLSQKTPSVCNRQAWRVHIYTDKQNINELLDIQAGSRGFGDQSSALLVITCDLTRFVNVDERYQAWIDGGMFSMSLCLSFHYYGYGTCCLNWSKDRKDDIKLRAVSDILPEEQVIMMIAVGTLPENFKVARSPRRPIEDVLVIH